jgi:glutathione-regulated potassium-efflux system ancillary protein KefG
VVDLLAPLPATAYRCRLPRSDPFIAYEADKLSPEALEAVAADYAAMLECWIAATSTSSKKAA